LIKRIGEEPSRNLPSFVNLENGRKLYKNVEKEILRDVLDSSEDTSRVTRSMHKLENMETTNCV